MIFLFFNCSILGIPVTGGTFSIFAFFAGYLRERDIAFLNSGISHHWILLSNIQQKFCDLLDICYNIVEQYSA